MQKLPVQSKAGIVTALETVFGDAPVSNWSVLAGGRSQAQMFSFCVSEVNYVLRCSELHQAEREHCCMKIAAQRGVAPALHYTNPEQGVAIMSCVIGGGSRGEPLPPLLALERVATTLRRLHTGPSFPEAITIGTLLKHMERQLQAWGQPGLPALLVEMQLQLAENMAKNASTAPCHHDLNPTNILAGLEKTYFIDWETAGQGDPYIDLAQLGVFSFPSNAQREALHRAYLQREPTPQEKRRAQEARIVAFGFYAAAFMGVSARQKSPDWRKLLPLSMPKLLEQLRATDGQVAANIMASALWAETRRLWVARA